jgi:RimJ/RimL family protein N-acetyltransferase
MTATRTPGSPRLVFRCWSEADVDLAVALWGDPEVTRLIGAIDPRARLAQEIATHRDHGIQYWPIFLASDGAHVGCAGLRPRDADTLELGFHLTRAHWGRGLASEAARATIAFAFDTLRVRALFAGHHPDNEASRRVLAKLGFVHTHDELYPATGRMHPSYLLHAR